MKSLISIARRRALLSAPSILSPTRTFTTTLAIRQGGPHPFMTPPGPIPLGDKEQQREIDEMIRRGGVSEVELSEEEMEDEMANMRHPDAEKEPLKPFENDTNPNTGEKGGPKGPEPTRYGDWERKVRKRDLGAIGSLADELTNRLNEQGRVYDF